MDMRSIYAGCEKVHDVGEPEATDE